VQSSSILRTHRHGITGAWILEAEANPEEALRSFEEAVKLKPDFAPLQTSLGLLLQRRGDPDGAVKAFTKVVQLTPSDPEAHNNLALALLQRGEADAAIKEFQEAILSFGPTTPDFKATWERRICRRRISTPPRRSFASALKLDPARASLHHDLALALKLKDDLPGAIAEWKEAIRLRSPVGGRALQPGSHSVAVGRFSRCGGTIAGSDSDSAELRRGLLHASVQS
jgi:hypothetical protein